LRPTIPGAIAVVCLSWKQAVAAFFLTLKFKFNQRRPPVPEKDHVVMVWLGG
jgi:hypothetical protein